MNNEKKREYLPTARVLSYGLKETKEVLEQLVTLESIASAHRILSGAIGLCDTLRGVNFDSNRGERLPILPILRVHSNGLSSLQDVFSSDGELVEIDEETLAGDVRELIANITETVDRVEQTFNVSSAETAPTEDVQPARVLKDFKDLEEVDAKQDIAEVTELPDLPDYLHNRMDEMKVTIDKVTSKYRSKVKKLKKGEPFALSMLPILLVSDPGLQLSNINRTKIKYDELVGGAFVFYNQIVVAISTDIDATKGKNYSSPSFKNYVETIQGSVEGMIGQKVVVVNPTEPFRMKGIGGQVFLWMVPVRDFNKLGSTIYEHIGFPFNVPAEVRKASTKDLTKQYSDLNDEVAEHLKKETSQLNELDQHLVVELSKIEALDGVVKDITSAKNLLSAHYQNEKDEAKRRGYAARINESKGLLEVEQKKMDVATERLRLIKGRISKLKSYMRGEAERIREIRFKARHKTK